MKRLSCVALLLLCLLAETAFGQFDTAEVLGTVRDHTGAVIVQRVREISKGIVAKHRAGLYDTRRALWVKIKIKNPAYTRRAETNCRGTADLILLPNIHETLQASLQRLLERIQTEVRLLKIENL